MEPKRRIDELLKIKNMHIRLHRRTAIVLFPFLIYAGRHSESNIPLIIAVCMAVAWAIGCWIDDYRVDKRIRESTNDQLISDVDELVTLIFDKQIARNTNIKDIIHSAETKLREENENK